MEEGATTISLSAFSAYLSSPASRRWCNTSIQRHLAESHQSWQISSRGRGPRTPTLLNTPVRRCDAKGPHCPDARRSTLDLTQTSEKGGAKAQVIELEGDANNDTLLTAENSANELHIRVKHISRLYTDDTGQFPKRSHSGNQYVMVAYHCDCDANIILACPFKSQKDQHRLAAYNSIMTRLKKKGLTANLQILDNEASAAYKKTIKEEWGAKF